MSFISYAQNGEDVILWRALKDVEKGFYIDVGACDPDDLSVTKAFYERGWHGINIEPVREYYELCLAKRPRDINLNVAVTAKSGIAHFMLVNGTGLSTTIDAVAAKATEKGWAIEAQDVPALSLSDICETLPPGEIHFLKIDVEGGEQAVLKGADFNRWRPWIIVVEATTPLSTERNEHLWEDILLQARYERAFFDGVNLYYLAKEHIELIGKLAAPPNALDDFKPVRLAEAEKRIADLIADDAAKQQELAEAHTALEKLRQEQEFLKMQAIQKAEAEAAEAAKLAVVQNSVIARLKETLFQMQHTTQNKITEIHSQASHQASSRQHTVDFVTRMLAKSRRKVTELEQLVHTETSSLKAIEARYRELESEYLALRQHRDQLLLSTSWRLSAPLRKLRIAFRVVHREPSQLMPLVMNNLLRRQSPKITSYSMASPIIGKPADFFVPTFSSLPLPEQDTLPGTAEYKSLGRRDQIAALIRSDITQRRLASRLST